MPEKLFRNHRRPPDDPGSRARGMNTDPLLEGNLNGGNGMVRMTSRSDSKSQDVNMEIALETPLIQHEVAAQDKYYYYTTEVPSLLSIGFTVPPIFKGTPFSISFKNFSS
ncbi:hypothetical protein E2542_SST04655 [Spatholobus suberectus]|nr:hypothetical protein E2542_SST04655 [Spatholobus suberectus]